MSGSVQYELTVIRSFGSHRVGDVITDQTVVANILSSPFAPYTAKSILSGGGTGGGPGGGTGETPPPGSPYITGVSLTGTTLVFTMSTGPAVDVPLPVSGGGVPQAPYVTGTSITGNNLAFTMSNGSLVTVPLPSGVVSISVQGNSLVYAVSDGSLVTVPLPDPTDTSPPPPTTFDLSEITDLSEYPGTPGNFLTLDANSKLTDEPLNLAAVKDVSEYPGVPGNLLALDQLGRLTDVPPIMSTIQDMVPFPGAPLSLLGFDAAGRPTCYPLTGNTATLAVNVPLNPIQGTALLLTGTCTGSTPLAMDCSADGGATWVAMSPFVPNGGTWSGTGPVPAFTGSMTIMVRDHNAPAVQATSSTFTVAAGQDAETVTVVTPTSATQGVAVPLSGTYAVSQPLAMDYSVDGGTTWVGMTGFTSGSATWSGNGPAPAVAGSLTIMVRDHSSTSVQATTNSFIVGPSPAVLPTISNPIFAVDTTALLGQFWQDTALTVPSALGQPVKGLKSTIDPGDRLIATVAPTWMSGVKGRMNGLRFTSATKTLLHQSTTIIPMIPILQGNKTAPASFTGLFVFTPASLPTASAPMTVFSAGVSGGAFDSIALSLTTAGLAFSVLTKTVTSTAIINMVPVANGVIACVVRYTNQAVPMKLAAQGFTEVSRTPSGTMGGTNWGYVWLGNFEQSSNGFQPFDGWIHELRLWNFVATDPQRDALLTYANKKWGT